MHRAGRAGQKNFMSVKTCTCFVRCILSLLCTCNLCTHDAVLTGLMSQANTDNCACWNLEGKVRLSRIHMHKNHLVFLDYGTNLKLSRIHKHKVTFCFWTMAQT